VDNVNFSHSGPIMDVGLICLSCMLDHGTLWQMVFTALEAHLCTYQLLKDEIVFQDVCNSSLHSPREQLRLQLANVSAARTKHSLKRQTFRSCLLVRCHITAVNEVDINTSEIMTYRTNVGTAEHVKREVIRQPVWVYK